MDHTNSAIFQRNYMSRMIRYDTQAAYQGTASRAELIRAANRMSRLIDPRRLKGPTDEQRENLRREAEIKELCDRRDQLLNTSETSSSLCTRRKDNSLTISTRKLNALWNGFLKQESGTSRSRFKQNTTPSLQCKTFAPSWLETQSPSIRSCPPQDLFNTRLQRDLASSRPSSIRRPHSVLMAMWIGGSLSSTTWCRFALSRRAGSARPLNHGRLR